METPKQDTVARRGGRASVFLLLLSPRAQRQLPGCLAACWASLLFLLCLLTSFSPLILFLLPFLTLTAVLHQPSFQLLRLS